MALPYKLEYFGIGSTATDISNYVESIDKFTDVGTGEIVSAKIMLDARFGDFITQSSSGNTPVIQQYDTFKLEITDDDDNTYSRFLIQDDVIPYRNDNGDHLVLELFGRERYLQKMYFTGGYFFISLKRMLEIIRDFYNTNKGSRQPSISGEMDNVPDYTFGSFDFGEGVTVYDAFMQVIKRLSLSVAAGGGGEFYGITFSDESQSEMTVDVRPQGSLPSEPLTLESPITVTELKQPSDGNIVIVKGQDGAGSLPEQPALWRSLIEEFENLPLWDNTIEYKPDAYVRYDDKIYQAKSNYSGTNISPTDATNWDVISFADYVEAYTNVSDFQYSPWTNNKQAVWKNWGGNPDGGDSSTSSFLANAVPTGGDAFDSLCFPDSNLVIRDRTAWRDWVDFRVVSINDIPDGYLYDDPDDEHTVAERTYRGMRVLVDPQLGEIGEPFTANGGRDKLNHSYENALVMRDRDGDWIVFRNAEHADEVAVMSEGKIYEFNAPQQTVNGKAVRHYNETNSDLGWRDSYKGALGNDAFHYPSRMENVDGIVGGDENSIVSFDKGSNESFKDDSAIEIEYLFGENDSVDKLVEFLYESGSIPILQAIRLFDGDGNILSYPDDDTENLAYAIDQYSIGWWATLFEVPFPKANYGISEDVGELFGGNVDSNVPTLNLFNMNKTPTGNTGYGHEDSHLLGQIDGIKFMFKFEIEGPDVDVIRGDIPFRCTVYDLNGAVWVSDTTHRYQGDTYPMNFPFSSFRLYRARAPHGYGLKDIISKIINPELKSTEILNRRLIKRITLQCMINYDSQGTYYPWGWENILRTITTLPTGVDIKYIGTIDALHFTKTPIAIARDGDHPTNSIDDRHLAVPIKKYPHISNVIQLQKIATSELDIVKHQNDTWTVKYENRADIHAEESIFLKDEDFVSESEKTNVDNTRKLVVKKITYSVGDRRTTSGLISTIDLYRRITV